MVGRLKIDEGVVQSILLERLVDGSVVVMMVERVLC